MNNPLNTPFLSCDEFAKLLTVKVSTVYAWLHYKQLPKEIYCKLGRKPLFFREAVLSWVLSGAKLNPKSKYNNIKK